MQLNSEIRKHLWLDFSPQRTIGMPLVLGMIVFVVHLWGAFGKNDFYEALAGVGGTVFWVLAYLWGGYKAAHGIADELKENTWDNIRLSPISAAQLSFGKLYGSTLYTWYGTIMALGMIACGHLVEHGAAYAAHDVIIRLLSVIGTHAFIILLMIRSAIASNHRDTASVIAVLILGIFVGQSFYNLAALPYQLGQRVSIETINWYGFEIAVDAFALFSMLAVTSWVLTGLYRSTREALQQRSRPFVWASFILFWIFYSVGLTHEFVAEKLNDLPYTAAPYQVFVSGMGFSVACIFTYLALFSERVSITRYRKIRMHYNERNYRSMLEHWPLWMMSIAIVTLCFVLTCLHFMNLPSTREVSPLLLFLALLFLLRDIGIVVYTQINPESRRSGQVALFYLAVLYLLFPLLLLHGKFVQFAFFFYPAISDFGLFATLPVLGQCVIVALLLNDRVRKLRMA